MIVEWYMLLHIPLYYRLLIKYSTNRIDKLPIFIKSSESESSESETEESKDSL